MTSARIPNLLPALDEATEAALRASIERFGVLVPVAVDQHDRILDGHHRSRIARELGVGCPMATVYIDDEADARQIAVELNTARRQMNAEQRREVVAVLREQGHSLRAIAAVTGVSKSQVANDVEELSTTGQLDAPERTVGLDGKSRPAHNTAPQPEPDEREPREEEPVPAEDATALNYHQVRSGNRQARSLREIVDRLLVYGEHWGDFNLDLITGVLADEERQKLASDLGAALTGLRRLHKQLEGNR